MTLQQKYEINIFPCLSTPPEQLLINSMDQLQRTHQW